MNAINFRPARDLRAPMEDMIRTYGLLPVVTALIRALFPRRRVRARPLRVNELSDHLRRDIGLEPLDRRSRDWSRLWDPHISRPD